MVAFAFVLSVLTINLLMIMRNFGRDSLCTIICGVSVIALLVPAWIITVSRSSCNKAFRFCCMSSTLLLGIGRMT